jgi:hypothetical protein
VSAATQSVLILVDLIFFGAPSLDGLDAQFVKEKEPSAAKGTELPGPGLIQYWLPPASSTYSTAL